MELLSIGRSAQSDFRLASEACSKIHAYLLRGKDGSFLLIDRGSSNGTRVKEGDQLVKVQQRRLDIDEQFFIGDVGLTARKVFEERFGSRNSSRFTTIRNLSDGRLIEVEK